jgi:hypothetical protein
MPKRLLLVLIASVALVGCGSSTHHGTGIKGPIARYYVHGPEASKLAAPSTLVHLHGKTAAVARTPVPATPTGPSGSYKLVYGDNFSATIGSGSGQDSGWKANEHDQGCCSNGDEIAAERPSKVRTSEAGLEVNCDRESTAGKSFTCGGADTSTPNGFKFKYGSGITFAVQTRMKVPLASGCAEDPGWWASDPSWTDEFDFFEFWGWNAACKYSGGIVWIYKTPSSSTRQQCEPWEGCGTWVPNPDGEYHTYTTVVSGTGSFEEWIDGKHRASVGGASANTPWEHLIFTHALRQASGSTSPRFTSTSTFHIDYVSVYEIGSGSTEHSGLAPGTTVSGEPTPPPPTTETTPPPPPPPPTETTPPPPPPPPSVPATPTGLKATPGAGISVSWSPDSGATGYHLYRTGPWPTWVPVGSPWTTLTGTSAVNKAEVVTGREYCFRLSAFNANGTSALTAPVCVKA